MSRLISMSIILILGLATSVYAQTTTLNVPNDSWQAEVKRLESAGERKAARSRIEEALKSKEAGLTREQKARDTSIAFTRIRLAESYIGSRDYEQAEYLAKEAISAGEKAFQGNKKTYVYGLIVLANLYRHTGRTEFASAMCDRFLPMLIETHAKTAPIDYAHNLLHCGHTYTFSFKHEKSDEIVRKAVQLYEKHLGSHHSVISVALAQLGTNFLGQKKYDLSIKAFRRAEEHYDKYPTPDISSIAKSYIYDGIGVSLQKLGREIGRAEELLKKSLNLRLSTLPPTDMRIAHSKIRLGNFLVERGKFEQSLTYFEETIPAYEKHYGHNHGRTNQVLESLRDAYDGAGFKDKAKAIRHRLDQMPPKGSRAIHIYYATNRNFIEGSQNRPFSTYGPKDTDVLKLGWARLHVPQSEIEARADRVAGGGGLIEQSRGPLTSTDKLEIVKVRKFQSANIFSNSAAKTLKQARRFKKKAIVFVHGYNVSFDDALQRTAQIAFDLDFDGLLVTFSWPSKRKASQYLSDTASADVAVEHLLNFIEILQKQLSNTRINFIAHSMGTRILLGALERISDRRKFQNSEQNSSKFGELILAHADIDAQRCRQLLKNVRPTAQGITLYVHKSDWALWLSNKLRSRERCGAQTQVYKGVDTIDTSQMKADKTVVGLLPAGWNHDVFVRNSLLFSEISRLLRTGRRPPTKRTPEFATVTTSKGLIYWAYDPKRDLFAQNPN